VKDEDIGRVFGLVPTTIGKRYRSYEVIEKEDAWSSAYAKILRWHGESRGGKHGRDIACRSIRHGVVAGHGPRIGTHYFCSCVG